MRPYFLFLDDERYPHYVTWINLPLGHWFIARDLEEFKRTINIKGMPELVSFDHDLAEEHYKHATADYIPYDEYKIPTGWHCAKWLVEECKRLDEPIPLYAIHTLNKTGKINIEKILNADD